MFVICEKCSHPRHELPDDPNVNMWAYYSNRHVYPIFIADFLIVILSIPLLDRSLQMDPYRVYNLPTFHPELKVQFTIVLNQYLVIYASGTYVTVPTLDEIHICLATDGHFM